jgi:hypothetical protein
MAAYIVTDERYPALYQRTFTTFVGGRVLHSTDAPAKAQYLPCLLIVQVAAADVLEWTDESDVTNTITFAAAGVHQLRIPAKTLTTNTTADSVTVCWSQKG